MFYCDVPAHSWQLFGSHAKQTARASSDLDICLRFAEGDPDEHLQHPYFANLIEQLNKFSTEKNGILDLFVDYPAERTLRAIFSNGTRELQNYDEVTTTFREIDIFQFMRTLRWWTVTAEPRSPIQSFTQTI